MSRVWKSICRRNKIELGRIRIRTASLAVVRFLITKFDIDLYFTVVEKITVYRIVYVNLGIVRRIYLVLLCRIKSNRERTITIVM